MKMKFPVWLILLAMTEVLWFSAAEQQSDISQLVQLLEQHQRETIQQLNQLFQQQENKSKQAIKAIYKKTNKIQNLLQKQYDETQQMRILLEQQKNDMQQLKVDFFNELQQLKQQLLQNDTQCNKTQENNEPIDTTSHVQPVATTASVFVDQYDCSDIFYYNSLSHSGIYRLNIGGNQSFDAYCDMTTRPGGWTVIQRRQDGSENFSRSWEDYKAGFGHLSGEFWLGNEKLAAMTSAKQYILRVDLKDWSNDLVFAEYSSFKVGDESTQFLLQSVGKYTSQDIGDSLTHHKGMKFSTYDRDNDAAPEPNDNGNCAMRFHGGWWYRICHRANLNGEYNNTREGEGINWADAYGYTYSLKFTEMKIRPYEF